MSDLRDSAPVTATRLNLERIVAGAAGLDTLLSPDTETAPGDPDVAARRLDAWRRSCARGDRDALRRRLAWDDWDQELCVRRLGALPSIAGPAPGWAQFLEHAVGRAESVADEMAERGEIREERLFPAGRSLPFVHLFAPFLREAEERLDRSAAKALELLAAGARDDLSRRLLNDLVLTGGKTLAAELQRHLAIQGPLREAGGNRLYRRFVDSRLRGRLVDLLEARPVLARRIGLLGELWVSSHVELLDRLYADRGALAAIAGETLGPGVVSGVRTALSDRHQGGRQVEILRLRSGVGLVYKPRPLALEAAWQRSLSWLAGRGAPVPGPLRVLDRAGYGWMEPCEPAEIAPSQAPDYLRKAGSLLCLAHLLGGSDLHAGNLIGAEDGPHLIDAETLLQPEAPVGIRGPAASDPFARTQLLFSTQTDADGHPYDFGGLTGSGGAVGELQRPVWRYPNTDSMRLEPMPAVMPEPGNRPIADDRPVSPSDHPAAFLDGYERTYRVILEHGRELLDEDGPLAAARRATTRVLARPSQTYGALLSRLREPRYERSGVPGDLLVDSLNRAFHPFLHRHPVWDLAGPERRSLRDLDVPVFRLGVDETRFPLATGETTRPCFERSGWQALRSRLESLSAEELQRHLTHLGRLLLPSPKPGPDLPAPGSLELISAARAVADQLVDRATAEGRGWLRPEDAPAGASLSLDLYDGATGTALFLGVLGRVTGDDRYLRSARRGIEPVVHGVADPRRNFPTLGACHGLGGVVYGLVGLARALEDDTLLDAAEEAARRATPERLRTDEVLDVATGLAGAALGLLALRRHRSGEWLDDRISAARDRLVETARPCRDGVAWPTPAGEAHGGMAHGASGICLALHRLARDRDPSLLALVAAGFRGEAMTEQARSLGPELGFSWCHGVAGAGIARSAVVGGDARGSDRPEGGLAGLREAIDRASRATLQSGLSVVDHLCCGTGGRIELLLQAARVASDPWLLTMAREGARRLVSGRDRRGDFRLRSESPVSPYDPGLFRGTAGIGFQLLRAALPEEVPAVLAFEEIP